MLTTQFGHGKGSSRIMYCPPRFTHTTDFYTLQVCRQLVQVDWNGVPAVLPDRKSIYRIFDTPNAPLRSEELTLYRAPPLYLQ